MSSEEAREAPCAKSTGLAGVTGQGALLVGAFGLSQAMGFTRNALLGHWLAKGDFGIAATLTLILQLIDILSDLGADRLIVQAKDGDEPRFVATQHVAVIARGVLSALVIWLTAGLAAHFFGVPEAAPAFAAVALVPFVRGFQHLDFRRAQRRLDNRPFAAAEVVPQAVALAVTIPALWLVPDYWAVVWISLIQAGTLVLISHTSAERPYQLALDRDALARLISFGWPIWLSAFPLVAVYHCDRIVIGHFIGMEALAAYTVAFMATMAPGLVASKVANALMLPLLAAAKDERERFATLFAVMSEVSILVAALYLAAFVLLGEWVLPIAFGAQYAGLGVLAGWLALIWALRMLQAAPGMALMADGATRPFLVAGLIRALGVVPAGYLAMTGHDLAVVAATGAPAELGALAYIVYCVRRRRPGLGRIFVMRAGLLVPVAAMSVLVVAWVGSADPWRLVLVSIAVLVLLALLSVAVLPNLRASAARAVSARVTVAATQP